MASRPSEPLLHLIRAVSRKRGMNTAALAKAVDVPRAHLKHVLAGAEPLTVDELIALAQALDLGPAELGALPLNPEDPTQGGSADGEPDGMDAAPPTRGTAALAMVGADSAADPIGAAANAYGNHSEQILRLGLALGCDIHLVMDTALITESGVPKTTLAQFKERLPIRLDAAFHRHHDVRFLPEALQLTLSFDALYTCYFPWAAIQQITLIPLAPDLDDPEPEDDKSDDSGGFQGGHLRLVE